MSLFDGFNIGTALSLFSTGVKVYDAIKSGNDSEAAYNAQAGSLRLEARRALIEARTVADTAYMQAEVVRREGGDTLSGARAGYAASGVDVNFGTARDVQVEIGQRVESDALNQILLGERQKKKLIDEAAALEAEANQADVAGGNAASAGYWQAAGSALQGGADAWSKWGKP